MTLRQLQSLVAKGEDSKLQFKVNITNAHSLASEMVAFSNSEGGQILIGVSDSGELNGLSGTDVQRINQLISNAASQHVKSPITVQTENIVVNEGRVVIVVTIPIGIDKPYFDNQGVMWLKNGADKRRVSSKEELRRLFQDVDLLHADQVPTEATVKDLDLQELSKFVSKQYDQDLPTDNKELVKFIENLNLAKDGKLNLAGLLLFSKRPDLFKPAFILKAICYPGNDISVDNYLDSEDFEGTLSTQYKGAMSFVMRNLVKIQLDQGINTTGKPEIDKAVFEELIVNALVHRDYFISSSIHLFMFNNRIELISPGHLSNNLTVEKIKAGISNIRNPILASYTAKGLLPYRGLGSGVRRALNAWPNIDFIEDRDACTFKVIINRSSVFKGAKNEPINEPTNEPLNDIQKQLVNVIIENPEIAYDEMAEKLGTSRSTVKRNIAILKKLGVLKRVGSKKSGHWEIIT